MAPSTTRQGPRTGQSVLGLARGRKAWATAVAVLMAALAPTLPAGQGEGLFESGAELSARGRIDELVFGRLEELGIPPANPCSDAVFVRRAFLDVIGTLCTAQEARAFLQDRSPDKRIALIDRLLEREEFADYWAVRWGDLLRVKAEFPINLWPNAAQAYHRWIRTSIREGMPYDRFVREMLTASGSNFRVPQVNFYRALQARDPESIAQAVALTFMGARAENWPQHRLTGMAAFFSQIRYKATGEWKEEIVYSDPGAEAQSPAVQPDPGNAVFPDGTPARLPAGVDPREVFSAWLTQPGNPWFARHIVNRIWCWLFGRGIIHEPDDIRPDNPPTHPEVLAFLERELVSSRYDLKHVYRLILNSQTYQLSCVPQSKDPRAEAHFAVYPVRRLEAEVLIDALCRITGTAERYTSAIPEPFTFIPESQPSIALPDGSITSPFLEMFGRPPRDTGLDSERNNRPTAEQRLHILNSSHIQRKIEQGPRLRSLIQSKGTPREAVTRLYLAILSRFPTERELGIADAYRQSGEVKGPQALQDVAWALINSAEFLTRH
ncbi:MAG: DUF1553 domain-containing protein [Phycisphaerae bacterium]|nr:DUF1553 domain-containing protein [Phycisphaerae bacterium]